MNRQEKHDCKLSCWRISLIHIYSIVFNKHLSNAKIMKLKAAFFLLPASCVIRVSAKRARAIHLGPLPTFYDNKDVPDELGQPPPPSGNLAPVLRRCLQHSCKDFEWAISNRKFIHRPSSGLRTSYTSAFTMYLQPCNLFPSMIFRTTSRTQEVR